MNAVLAEARQHATKQLHIFIGESLGNEAANDRPASVIFKARTHSMRGENTLRPWTSKHFKRIFLKGHMSEFEPKTRKIRPTEAQCESCSQTFPVLPHGRIPRVCAECKPNSSNRLRTLRSLAKTNPPSSALARPLPEDGLAAIREAGEIERLAIGLSITSNIRGAAARVGLSHRSDAELEAMAHAARHLWADLIARKPGALGAMLSSTIGLIALGLRERASLLGPHQSASTLKSLAQTLEMVQGTVQPVYSNFQIIVRAPEPEKSDAPKSGVTN